MVRIFLCHASEDKLQVREVYQRLTAIAGFEPWLDEEDLLPGQDWEYEIPRALKAADFILIFFSSNSVAKRGYVQREMKLALDALQEIPAGEIFTIPVRLDACEVPEPFRRYHYANLFDPRGFDRLVTALHRGLEQRGQALSEVLATPQPGKTWVNSIGMEFVLIPAGTFIMGSPDTDQDADDDEKPAHRVTISQPFYMGKYPVTQAQWEAVMGENPSRFKGDPNRPVDHVSWDAVQTFIRKVNENENTFPCRLPTEAQWEYACRAGETTRYSFGDSASQLGEYAWYAENAGGATHPVGQRKPNPWGLYDMHGNAWEWVQDYYGDYPAEAVVDPDGPAAGAYRVFRGGSWDYSAQFVRAAHRYWLGPGIRYVNLGFRCSSSGLSQ